MSLRFLLDVNLSPEWIPALKPQGWPALRWTSIGDARAKDTVIMEWAKENQYVVFTNDLDFGRMLALTHATGQVSYRFEAAQ